MIGMHEVCWFGVQIDGGHGERCACGLLIWCATDVWYAAQAEK
jgi:hypothetical protein